MLLLVVLFVAAYDGSGEGSHQLIFVGVVLAATFEPLLYLSFSEVELEEVGSGVGRFRRGVGVGVRVKAFDAFAFGGEVWVVDVERIGCVVI
jgi:hypothetical protein